MGEEETNATALLGVGFEVPENVDVVGVFNGERRIDFTAGGGGIGGVSVPAAAEVIRRDFVQSRTRLSNRWFSFSSGET